MFFILPIAVDYKARRYPMVTFVLIGLNVLLYLVAFAASLSEVGEEGADSFLLRLCLVPAEKTWWTWITSMFAHAGFFHLAGNMVYLFLFGSCVEDMMGRASYTVFYLAGGLVAGASQVLITAEAEADIPILGASGAVSACIGAFLILLPKRDINFQYIGWFFFRAFIGQFAVKAWKVILLWFFVDFSSMILEWRQEEGGGGVAFAAHVGGTLVGGLAMLALRRAGRVSVEGGEAEEEAEGDGEEAPALEEQDASTAGLEAPSIYLSINGEQAGPYPPSTVQSMLELGSIPPGSYYWREGMDAWRSISEWSNP